MLGMQGSEAYTYRVLPPAFGFYTITMTMYYNGSTAGGTTKAFVKVERVQ